MTNFNALVTREINPGEFKSAVEVRAVDELPAGDVLIRVQYSSLNYKDSLSAAGNRGVTRKYPHTPGIDAAGTVVESANAQFKAGDEVIVTGYDLGMNTAGGLAQMIRVPAAWVVRKPSALSLRDAMVFGTAGLTAALCVDKLLKYGVTSGRAVVTGASGGVGSIACLLLKKLGFTVDAVTAKADFVAKLGVDAVLARDAFAVPAEKAMVAPRWNAAVDTVGGPSLAAVIKQLQHSGAVSCCGMVESPALATTVFPFILRGVGVLGVDSVEIPLATKAAMWEKLAGEWRLDQLETVTREITLADVPKVFPEFATGSVSGRILVRID